MVNDHFQMSETNNLVHHREGWKKFTQKCMLGSALCQFVSTVQYVE